MEKRIVSDPEMRMINPKRWGTDTHSGFNREPKQRRPDSQGIGPSFIGSLPVKRLYGAGTGADRQTQRPKVRGRARRSFQVRRARELGESLHWGICRRQCLNICSRETER